MLKNKLLKNSSVFNTTNNPWMDTIIVIANEVFILAHKTQ